jgi:hypothetical protein
MLFKRNLVNHAKQNGKKGLSIIGDIGGAYTHKSKHNELVDYELSLPTKFDVDMIGFVYTIKRILTSFQTSKSKS